MFKKGFTLAEVLITLAVIGVVAAMSIPALIGSTNQQEFKVGLKKAVSVLNQALTMSIALDSTYASDQDTSANLMELFKGKMNVLSTNGTTGFYTADGMYYDFTNDATNDICDTTGTGTDWSQDQCYVLVDVNGAKGPNKVSSGNDPDDNTYRDQYYLVIRDRMVVPHGNSNDTVAQDAMTY